MLITSTGGDNLVRTNVISGNTRNGIELAGRATGVTVDPDIVGLDTEGNGVLPNGGDGVLIDGTAHGNAIGGSRRSVIPQNTFSGNDGYGRGDLRHATTTGCSPATSGPGCWAWPRWATTRAASCSPATRTRTSSAPSARPANLISGNTGNGVTLRARTSRTG